VCNKAVSKRISGAALLAALVILMIATTSVMLTGTVVDVSLEVALICIVAGVFLNTASEFLV
jgi:hypothetical protein